MMFQSPGQIAFSIGSFGIHWYGIMIVLGIFGALFYATHELRRHGLSPDVLYDMGFWVILAGVIGARLYYVIFQWPYYYGNLVEIPQIWRGGLAIHGALIFGFLALLAFCKVKKINWLMFLDVLAPGVILAQAFGRFGNFFNNEAFGSPTDLPWKLFIPEAFRPEGFMESMYFHPTFLYEALWNIAVFLLLFILARKIYNKGALQKTKPHGAIFFSYLAFYSFGRFFIEGLRLDSLFVGPLRAAQILSTILFIIGVVGILNIIDYGRSLSGAKD